MTCHKTDKNDRNLNPIENCWKLVGVKLAAKRPRNKRELEEAIIHVWNYELTAHYFAEAYSVDANAHQSCDKS